MIFNVVKVSEDYENGVPMKFDTVENLVYFSKVIGHPLVIGDRNFGKPTLIVYDSWME